MKRPTMKDIAREAGVSRGAASFALNDRPGVSEQTRARVKKVAADMGWTPSLAALSLSSRRAHAVGLVIARDNDAFASEAFFLKLISGVTRVLQPNALSLVLQVVPSLEAECSTYRSWWAEGRVDGVLLVDPQLDDPRPELLADIGLPAVVIGGDGHGERVGGLATDDEGAMRLLVKHLFEQGHTRLAYVIGLEGLLHTKVRSRALSEAAAGHGMVVTTSGVTDFTEDAGRTWTGRLLESPDAPTAIIFDNEILALGGLSAIHRMGLECPSDVAVVSCEDSPLCQVVQPNVTALVRDPASLGEHATRMMLELIEGGDARTVTEPLPSLDVRGSSVSP